MKSIDTHGVIDADGMLSIRVPRDIAPGEHRVVVVIEERADEPAPQQHVELPALDLGPWPANLSLRREDMYGDDGR